MPIVPWPAITSRSSKGWTRAGPVGVAGTRLGGTLPGQGQGVVDRLARQRHAGTEPLHGLDLENGSSAGHEHLAGDPVQKGRLGDGAAVVARAGGDEPGRGTWARERPPSRGLPGS